MTPEFIGVQDGRSLRIAVIVSRFNGEYTERLLEGALKAFGETGVQERDIDMVRVPGAFELRLLAQPCADSGNYSIVLCLGVIIRSDTPHFDFVAAEAARGIMQTGLETGVPVIFGVLTLANEEQAKARTRPDDTNRGYQAALVGIEMATLLEAL